MKRSMLSLSLLCVTFSVGCGLAGQRFHGDYSTSGTSILTFNNYGSATTPVTAPVRVSEGVDSDIVILAPGGTCAMPADVDGDVATIKSGTICTDVVDGLTLNRTLTGGTAVLVGKTLQLNFSGTFTATGNGQTFPGSFSQSLSLTRVSK